MNSKISTVTLTIVNHWLGSFCLNGWCCQKGIAVSGRICTPEEWLFIVGDWFFDWLHYCLYGFVFLGFLESSEASMRRLNLVLILDSFLQWSA